MTDVLSRLICLSLLALATLAPTVFAAHFIVGQVSDALDGTLADGQTVILWNPLNGTENNISDIIGPTGNSGSSNTYMFDCELLNASCEIGQILRIEVIDTGTHYVSSQARVNITGKGFDIASSLTLNSPPSISVTFLDDSQTSPINEIDLTAGGNKTVLCYGIITDVDGQANITNASGRFFHSSSIYGAADDYNNHYTNGSCLIDTAYGTSNEANVSCMFDLQYYALSSSWNCTIEAVDYLSSFKRGSNTTSVNSLVAIGVDSFLDYGLLNTAEVSPEKRLNVTNYGNVPINLSLLGYAVTLGDNNSMNCSAGTTNISIYYEKYNLTSSNTSNLTLPEFESLYRNLTAFSFVNTFGLGARANDLLNDAYNTTYWRMYVPAGVEGTCRGNVVFGATQGAGT